MALSNAERQRRYRERQRQRKAAGEVSTGAALPAEVTGDAYEAIDAIGRRALAALQSAKSITPTEAIRVLKIKIEADRLKQASAETRPTIRPSLYDFAAEVWPLVTSQPLRDTWHLRALAAHLEALADRRIRHLLVCLPPRLGKSIMASVVFPAWVWTWQPEAKILSASYADKLAAGFSASTRELFKSDWWRTRYDVSLSPAMDTRSEYRNHQGGQRVALSVFGSTTGRGGDLLILDDPHHPAEIRSTTERTKTLDWFKTSWYTRADDPNTARHLVVQQRLHRDDLAGELSRGGEWVTLTLPNERPAEPTYTALPWTDPRKTEGDLLCPELLDREETERRKRLLGGEYRSQYGQDPQPPGGALFTRESITILDTLPDTWALQRRVRFWDVAASAPRAGWDPDYTVGCRMAQYTRPDDAGLPIWVVEHVERFRGEPSTVDARIKAVAQTDGPEVEIIEEQEPGASGKIVISQRRDGLTGFAYSGKRLTGDPEIRHGPISTQAKAGNIALLAGTWNEALIDELCSLPGAKHDDQATAMSGAYVVLAAAPIEEVADGVF